MRVVRRPRCRFANLFGAPWSDQSFAYTERGVSIGMAKPSTTTADLRTGAGGEDGYVIDSTQAVAWAGAGLPAYAAARGDGPQGEFVAIMAAPRAPTRAQAIGLLTGTPAAGVMSPVWEGRAAGPRGEPAWFVVCTAPPGPPVWDETQPPAPWSESELLHTLLQPIAAALALLQARRVTHRAIRPSNLFHARHGDPVTLGAAWAAPPASLQPAVFEPPYIAMCPPSGRGEGSIADDVYALGVTLLVLALGRVPLADLDTREIVHRKLTRGSFEALAGAERLSPTIADLVRGMLAEDPDHRPAPALLADPIAARARRVAARPARRVQRPLMFGVMEVWDARSLAHAIANDPEQGLRFLRGGADMWLRRTLGDAALAICLDEVTRQRADAAPSGDGRADPVLLMLVIAALDPLAPLVWNGLALWPDGLGALIASADDDEAAALPGQIRQLILAEAVPAWINARQGRGDLAALRLDSRQHRSLLRLRGWGGGLPRLRYTLNTTLCCASPILMGQLVVRMTDLLPALERVTSRPNTRRGVLIDRHMAAFIAARSDLRAEAELAALATEDDPDTTVMLQLALLAKLQTRLGGRPLPNLAAAMTELLRPTLAHWHNRARRSELDRKMTELAGAGMLPALYALLDNPRARETDAQEAAAAQAELARIDAELAQLRLAANDRSQQARELGNELAACVGMMALSAMIVAAALSG